MPNTIYTREELKKEILSLNAITQHNNYCKLVKSKFQQELKTCIIEATPKCRDQFSERVFWILNDIEDYPNCLECGKQFIPQFNGHKAGYGVNKFCSNKCATSSPLRQAKIIATNLERTGFVNPGANPEIVQKKKANYKAKTGYDHHWQNPEIIAKQQQTNVERYGAATPFAFGSEKFETLMLEKHGVKNCSELPETVNKRKQTNFERTGYEEPLSNPEIIAKGKITSLEKFGTEFPMQNKEVQIKGELTRIELYGTAYPMQNAIQREQIKQTNIERYGVPNALQNSEIRTKGCETNIEKYRVPYPMQNAEFAESIMSASGRFKTKKATLPSGMEISYQGFELIAILELLKTYKEEDFLLRKSEVPEIWYETDKRHRYYSDIYIPSKNLIIEVKSEWTWTQYLETNLLKKQACLDAGYNYEFWICDAKQVLEIR